MKRILILAPYPQGEAPSQRFRFEHYLPFFHDHQITYRFHSFWTKRAWKILYAKGHNIQKLYFLFLGFARRFQALFLSAKFDMVFLHRETTPIGPPVFEFLLSKVWHKKIIYDFDDAIWLPNTSSANWFSAHLKFHHKVAYICEMSWKVSVGNSFLQQYALKFSKNVVINPTVVDTNYYHSKTKEHQEVAIPVIGWTGTHSTAVYLEKIETALLKLKKDCDFKFVVISNEPPNLSQIEYQFIPWKKEKEIEQLLAFDIGIMPLEDTIWEEGKCGFKIIQYFSLGIPTVASPVGVNKEIIDEGENGFFADSNTEWKKALRKLLIDPVLRKKMGMAGREKVEKHYSVQSNFDRFFSTLE